LRRRNYDPIATIRSYQPDAPLPRKFNPIVYEGRTYPSRTHLARHLAPLLGVTVDSVEKRLLRRRDDAIATIQSYQPTDKLAAPVRQRSRDTGRFLPDSEVVASSDVINALSGIRTLIESQAAEIARLQQQRRADGEHGPMILKRLMQLERLVRGDAGLSKPLRHTRTRPLGIE